MLPKARDQWSLSPDRHYLNHAAFGATPDPIIQAFHKWQREMERNPTEFFLERKAPLLDHIRSLIAKEFDAEMSNLALIENATSAMNIVAKSIPLQAGDEILLSTHEYGSVQKIWKARALEVGAGVRYFSFPFPWGDGQAILETIANSLSSKTKVIVIDHIVAATGLVLPVQKICEFARSQKLLSVVDGAHAPGQIDISLSDIAPDFYCGNFHKWLLAPKAAGFLYVDQAHHSSIQANLVSWGWKETRSGNAFYHSLEIQGTKDISAILAVEDALEFHHQIALRESREYCHAALRDFLSDWQLSTGLSDLYSDSQAYIQMAALPLPEGTNALDLRNALSKQFQVEVGALEIDSGTLLRISFQIYNSREDLGALAKGLEHVESRLAS